ncbi:MAG: hypothetical protein WBA13_00775 [Microcoleaceae cyanobacterium]
MKKISLSLYAFHLCQSLNQAFDEVDDRASEIWENLIKLTDKNLPFNELKNLRSHLICYPENTYKPAKEERKKYKLTKSDNINLGSISTTAGFKINGNLQAFRLHDTYAADLTLYADETQEIDIDRLQLFQPKSLLPDVIQANLGQTLWLYCEVDATENECEELAKKYAIAILAETSFKLDLDNINKGNLFDTLLFEFKAINPNYPEDLTQSAHLLISLNYQKSSITEDLSKIYDWLLELLCCYHKINSINSQVSQRYQEARNLYSKLDQEIDHLSQLIENNNRQTRLDDLKYQLIKLPKNTIKYSQCLGNIQALHTALATNTKNYEICLKKLEEIQEIPQFWQDFLQKTRDRDLVQIQTHLNYLSPAQANFQQAIDTIRGLVEIEQAEIDKMNETAAENRQKRLEYIITIVSIGLAVSGISSAVANETIITTLNQFSICPSTPQPEFYQQYLCSFSLILFHLSLGIILAIPIGILVGSLQKKINI